MNETALITNFIFHHKESYKCVPTMFDIGAFDGHTCIPFVLKKWNVYAFEPNPERYRFIEHFMKQNPNDNLTLTKKAVTNENKNKLTFFLSKESKGISSLTNFHNSHYKASFTVDTIRLDTFMKMKEVKRINFLKIDTEGHDFFVLQSYDWNKDHHPDIIECEFEDAKTVVKLNYCWKDMAEFLYKKKYHIIISEWFPIKRYGISHQFRKFHNYPCELKDVNAWGNFICFKKEDDFNKFSSLNEKYF